MSTEDLSNVATMLNNLRETLAWVLDHGLWDSPNNWGVAYEKRQMLEQIFRQKAITTEADLGKSLNQLRADLAWVLEHGHWNEPDNWRAAAERRQSLAEFTIAPSLESQPKGGEAEGGSERDSARLRELEEWKARAEVQLRGLQEAPAKANTWSIHRALEPGCEIGAELEALLNAGYQNVSLSLADGSYSWETVVRLPRGTNVVVRAETTEHTYLNPAPSRRVSITLRSIRRNRAQYYDGHVFYDRLYVDSNSSFELCGVLLLDELEPFPDIVYHHGVFLLHGDAKLSITDTEVHLKDGHTLITGWSAGRTLVLLGHVLAKGNGILLAVDRGHAWFGHRCQLCITDVLVQDQVSPPRSSPELEVLIYK